MCESSSRLPPAPKSILTGCGPFDGAGFTISPTARHGPITSHTGIFFGKRRTERCPTASGSSRNSGRSSAPCKRRGQSGKDCFGEKCENRGAAWPPLTGAERRSGLPGGGRPGKTGGGTLLRQLQPPLARPVFCRASGEPESVVRHALPAAGGSILQSCCPSGCYDLPTDSFPDCQWGIWGPAGVRRGVGNRYGADRLNCRPLSFGRTPEPADPDSGAAAR